MDAACVTIDDKVLCREIRVLYYQTIHLAQTNSGGIAGDDFVGRINPFPLDLSIAIVSLKDGGIPSNR